MTRGEMRDLLSRYESATDADASGLVRPTAKERELLGEAVLATRASFVRRARDMNRRFVETILQDLPEAPAAATSAPARPLCAIRAPVPATPTLPVSSYGSVASLCLHLMRDWSSACEHVSGSTYAPAAAELRRLLPKGGSVLVPGCGLGRLALELASAEAPGEVAEGTARHYRVEANDASRLFLTCADWILNRPPAERMPLMPLAHVFSENWGHEQQYLEIAVPSPAPRDVGGGDHSSPAMTLVPGDFAATYRTGGPCHRQFDAIVTCFFLDTATDFAELVEVMDGLLGPGGVWINVGPLNYRSDARLKMSWDEIVGCWENIGYEFVTQSRADVDYHIARGHKMYTESYHCALTSAIKRRQVL